MALRLEEDGDPTSDYLPDSQESSDSGSDGGESTAGTEETGACDKISLYESRVATMVAKRQIYLRNKVNSDQETDADETPSKKPGKGKGKAKEESAEGRPSEPTRKRVKKEAESHGFIFE